MILVNSPLSSLTPNERKENAAWKKNTKYRSRVSFGKKIIMFVLKSLKIISI